MSWKNEGKWKTRNNITTYMASYPKPHEMYENLPKYSRDKTEKQIPSPPPTKEIDNETMINLKKRIPFSFLIVPNEITGRNPHSVTATQIISDDPNGTPPIARPKVYLTPQVSYDDIPDPKLKQFVLDEIYISVTRKNELEFFNMEDIDKSFLDRHNIQNLKDEHQVNVDFNPRPLLTTVMTHKQNERGKTWTNEQIISNIDANKHFWQKKVMNEIDPNFSSLIKKEVKDQIRHLVETDKISMAHDYEVPGYAGYKPSNPFGISIAKKDLTQKHPFTSTYQSIYNSRRDVANSTCI